MRAEDFGSSDIESIVRRSADTILSLLDSKDDICRAGELLKGVLSSGGKVLTAGNGGSAAEALHLSEELIGRYKKDRPSLPSVCLCSDTTAITCIGNDYGFNYVFSRQIEGLGKDGDLFVAFSTSGNSENIVYAMDAARRSGLKTLALLGKDGGVLKGCADVEIIVEGETERIQEAHQVVLHALLECVEVEYEG